MDPEEYPLGPEEQAPRSPPNRYSPPPPAAGVQPLPYARPMPAYVSPGNTTFHQLAKASWVAPLIALCLGCFGNVASRGFGGAAGSILIGLVNIALILGGLTCGIIALCGVKRHGTSGILAPAIVGV